MLNHQDENLARPCHCSTAQAVATVAGAKITFVLLVLPPQIFFLQARSADWHHYMLDNALCLQDGGDIIERVTMRKTNLGDQPSCARCRVGASAILFRSRSNNKDADEPIDVPDHSCLASGQVIGCCTASVSQGDN